jgi:hypothetical protein
MWQRRQYEDAAAEIGKEWADSNGAAKLDDLCVKVARDNNLNPDGIRTLTRLANVCAFQELFAKEASDDRRINFSLGDPELVVSQLYQEAREEAAAPTEKLASYDFSQDYFGDLGMEKVAQEEEDEEEEDEDEKETAEEELEEEASPDGPVVDKKKVKSLFNRAKKDIEEEKKEAEFRWTSNIEKAAQALRVTSGQTAKFDKVAFEKDMIASAGAEAAIEVRALHLFTTGSKPTAICGGEKVAHVVDYHLPRLDENSSLILGFLKEAQAARYFIKRCDNGLAFIDQKMALVAE